MGMFSFTVGGSGEFPAARGWTVGGEWQREMSRDTPFQPAESDTTFIDDVSLALSYRQLLSRVRPTSYTTLVN